MHMPMYALCPFFLYEKSQKIGCEAGMMTFPSHRHKKKAMIRFCCAWNFENCKRYQRTMKKYGG